MSYKKKKIQNMYRDLHLFKGERRQVRCVVKDKKGKNIQCNEKAIRKKLYKVKK